MPVPVTMLLLYDLGVCPKSDRPEITMLEITNRLREWPTQRGLEYEPLPQHSQS